MPALLKKYQDRENGFTLVELLIVVLIIGILAAVAIPVYLGIQQQGYKAAIKADVNIGVKRVQVALTEGKTVADAKANPGSYTQKSVKGENMYLAASTTPGAGDNDYSISGVLNTGTTPAGPINYSYTYDSVTGQFTESSSGLAFGSANPSIVITTSSLPDAMKDVSYSQTVAASAVSPTSTTTWSMTGLPAGLNYNATTGIISGTPTGSSPGTVTVTATNGSVSDTRTYTLNVTAKPVITTAALPNPTQGTAYSQTLSATGSPNSGFTYAVTSGTLPAGLTLTSAGVLAGTPTATGPYSFSIAASNSAGTGAATAYSVVVGSVPTIAASASSATTIWPALSKIGYLPSEQPIVTGYPSPTMSATGLPTGVTIDSSTGALAGTPATAGSYNVTLSATNSYGTGTKNVTMNVLTGTNNYTWYMDQHNQDSAIGGGKIKIGGWVVESDSAHVGQYVSSGDLSKSNLRIDIQVNAVTVYTGLTDVARTDVNSAFGGQIGNMHGYAVTLNVGTGSKNIAVIARDGDNYRIIDSYTVNVN